MLTQGGAQFSIVPGVGTATGKHNQVQAPEEMLMKPKALTHLSLHSVPGNSLADMLSRDRQTETWPCQAVTSVQNGEALVHRTMGLLKNARIFAGPR